MTILQCLADIDPALGGSVEAPWMLTVALAKQGHSVEILTLRPPNPDWVKRWPGAVHCPGPVLTSYSYSKLLGSWLKVHAGEYDVLVIHGVWRYTSVGVWRALRRMNVPYVLYTHGMLDPFFNQFFLKRLKKLIMWRVVEHKVLRDARAVIFTCEEERLRSTPNFTPFVCNPVVVNLGIEAPIETSELATINWPAELEGKQVILFLGRLHPQKGCDTLIRAFAQVAARHPNLHLLMAGPDLSGWKSELLALAESSGVSERITWYGSVFGDAKWQLFRKVDAFILPSNYENFGISIVEALACGLPVLISNKAAVWREIEAAGAGLVASNTVEGTAEILEKWVQGTEQWRAQFRVNALSCFRGHYMIDTVARKLAAVLQSVSQTP